MQRLQCQKVRCSLTTVTCANLVSTTLGFLLMATPYLNNSIVVLTTIGDDNTALSCLTNFTACCSNSETGGSVFQGDCLSS